jgi:hypothetical protein
MKKTLLIAAAALAASVISSQAQVYSQNIVGYVNIPAARGYNAVANPLNCGNSLTNIITNPGGALDGTLVYVWNGAGYNTFTIDSTLATGVSDINDTDPVTPPTILPGQAFFFYNNTASSNNLTVVGQVAADGTGAGTVGVSTNTLGTSPQLGFYGSKFPVGGGLGTVLQFPATSGALDGALIQIPQINGAGNITGFTTYTVDSTISGGFSDINDTDPVPEPVISVGRGFFFQNNTGSPKKWVQSL